MTIAILLLSVALQCLCDRIPGLDSYLAYQPNLEAPRALIGLVTHMFAHGGWAHLIGNYEYGLPFMLFVEHKLGKRGLLEAFILCGLASALTSQLMNGDGGMIGSSGAIMGMCTLACMLFGETATEHLLAILYVSVAILPQIALTPMDAVTEVAHWGHVGGGLAGLMLASLLTRNVS
jgi:membrane associated rhomboid family serine protease